MYGVKSQKSLFLPPSSLEEEGYHFIHTDVGCWILCLLIGCRPLQACLVTTLDLLHGYYTGNIMVASKISLQRPRWSQKKYAKTPSGIIPIFLLALSQLSVYENIDTVTVYHIVMLLFWQQSWKGGRGHGYYALYICFISSGRLWIYLPSLN